MLAVFLLPFVHTTLRGLHKMRRLISKKKKKWNKLKCMQFVRHSIYVSFFFLQGEVWTNIIHTHNHTNNEIRHFHHTVYLANTNSNTFYWIISTKPHITRIDWSIRNKAKFIRNSIETDRRRSSLRLPKSKVSTRLRVQREAIHQHNVTSR